MKEFEKYDEQYCDRSTCSVCLSLDIYCKHCEELRKRGWREACKHWLKVAQEYDQEIQFMIEDELDD